MRTTRTRVLALSLGVVLLGLVGFVASGCGSSSGAGAVTSAASTTATTTPATDAAAPGGADLAAFRACLREHGVDDSGFGQGPRGGFGGGPPADGSNPTPPADGSSPTPPAGANSEAFEACRDLMPAGGGGFRGPNGGGEAFQAYRDCLEEQGVDMASADRASDEFQQATAACEDKLPAGGARPGAGTPPGGGDGDSPFQAYQQCLRDEGVDPDNPGDPSELQKAIDACRSAAGGGSTTS